MVHGALLVPFAVGVVAGRAPQEWVLVGRGVFFPAKGKITEREKKDSTYTQCIEFTCVHVYLPHWTVTSWEQWP